MSVLNLTHRDLDGIICSILIRKAYPNSRIVAGTYRNINDILKDELNKTNYENIFITDISIDEERWKPIIDDAFHFIDHHPREKETTIPNNLVNTKISACALTFMYLKRCGFDFSSDVKLTELVKYGNDYDLWTHKYQTSKYLNRLYYYYGFDRFLERFKDGFDGFNAEERKFLINNEMYLREVFKNVNHVKLNEFTIVAIVDDNIDEIADYLLKTNKGIDTIFIYNSKVKSLSMRGKFKGVDFGKFLIQFGGGGHKEAAAVRIETEVEMEKVIDKYLEERKALESF